MRKYVQRKNVYVHSMYLICFLACRYMVKALYNTHGGLYYVPDL